MENDLLAEVIAAERDIQQALEREQAKVQDWLEKRRSEIACGCREEEQRLRDACELQRTEAERAAAIRAEEIVRGAEDYARWLRALSEQEVRRAAGRHLVRILPG